MKIVGKQKSVFLKEMSSVNKIKVHESEDSLEIDKTVELNPLKLTIEKSRDSSVKMNISDIKPETWNNIPFPLVDGKISNLTNIAFSWILNSLSHKEKALEEQQEKFDEFVKKTEFQNTRFTKEVMKIDESVDTRLERQEK